MEKDFIAMINTHRGIIYKVCNLYGHEKDYKEDLFQEIVLQLWKSFPAFRQESMISTWMYRVALNTAISSFRRAKKKPESQSLSMAALEIPDMTDADEHARSAMLESAIQQLTKIEKALVMLYLEEKSYREISEIMGITQSNVGVKLNRTKSKLEKIIKADNNEHR